MHELQYARVTAASVEDAYRALVADVDRHGTPNNSAQMLLWLDVERAAVGVTEGAGESAFWEDCEAPERWQSATSWERAAWSSAYGSAQPGPLYRAWNVDAVRLASAVLQEVQAMPIAAIRGHFLELVLEEIRERYASLPLVPDEDSRLESGRRSSLVEVFELVHAAADGVLPFLPGLAPERWPARSVSGNGRTFYLLVDMHVSGI